MIKNVLSIGLIVVCIAAAFHVNYMIEREDKFYADSPSYSSTYEKFAYLLEKAGRGIELVNEFINEREEK